ncbi:MAG: hypothetical protein WD845_01005 [Pirellulales bacterium]
MAHADFLIGQQQVAPPPSMSGDVNDNGVTDIDDDILIRNNCAAISKTADMTAMRDFELRGEFSGLTPWSRFDASMEAKIGDQQLQQLIWGARGFGRSSNLEVRGRFWPARLQGDKWPGNRTPKISVPNQYRLAGHAYSMAAKSSGTYTSTSGAGRLARDRFSVAGSGCAAPRP